MTNNISDLLYGYSFDSNTITYNLNSGDAKWSGVYAPSGQTPIPLFASKSDLNSDWQSEFRTAIAQWDGYTALNISEVTGATDANDNIALQKEVA